MAPANLLFRRIDAHDIDILGQVLDVIAAVRRTQRVGQTVEFVGNGVDHILFAHAAGARLDLAHIPEVHAACHGRTLRLPPLGVWVDPLDKYLNDTSLTDVAWFKYDDIIKAWRDADSIDLLRTALGMVSGRVVNADATVICESPRLEGHRAEMERELEAALSASVSVKATSNEGMGWIGRNEGMACIAVVLVDLAAGDAAAAAGRGPG